MKKNRYRAKTLINMHETAVLSVFLMLFYIQLTQKGEGAGEGAGETANKRFKTQGRWI